MVKTPMAVYTPHPHDVLFGRGGVTNNHPGNQRFLQWVRERAAMYHGVAKMDKKHVCQEVIDLVHLQNPPGRFLQQTGNGQERAWQVVDETESLVLLAKAGQAFRDLSKREFRRDSSSNSSIPSPGLEAEEEETAGTESRWEPSRWHSYSRQHSAGGNKDQPLLVDDDDDDDDNGSLREQALGRFSNTHPGAPNATSVAPGKQEVLTSHHHDVYNKHSSSAKRPSTCSSNRVDQEHALKRRRLSWHAAANQQAREQQFDHLLFSRNKECDVEIVCRHDDELNHVSVSIPAHKTILAKSSPVMETIFQVNPDCRTLNFAYPAAVVQQVLVHVYHQRSVGNTITRTGGAIPAEQVAQLLELTKKFQWMDLYKQVFHRAYQSLTMHNLKWIVLQAWKNNDAMKELCRAYIKNHAVPVLTAPQFTVLANKEPQIWNDIVRAAVSGTHQGLGDSR
ncbi:expressed unknown protein [Seminavis robusta]|uniref:BTB domain-containing protein n=1 Tax=Seminavis robusta TaxID=568900 RepID=A0A9N8HSA4_9STRA|nr:expressed unknown protein [Seminavis robusta]|eukprot:Sro1147_g246410.1 n/a (450) ;mRNA; r:30069-31418